MAELSIPLLVLGTAYLYSNLNSKEEIEESFSNYNNNNLKNEDMNNVNKLEKNINNYHDKYYTKMGTSLSNAETNIQADSSYNPEDNNFVSLSGEVMNTGNITHNNMTPYFSSKLTGGSINNNSFSEVLLDNYTGSGSQQIEKKELGNFFKPEENVQNVYGNQNTNDFYQSRVNPSLKMNNVKPWEEERVAPGINKGYNNEGSKVGFNSGMESRDLWRPKTVDELRVENNKKQSYTLDGHMGPALDPVTERGYLGKTIKKTPDTYYLNTPDKWFTTTGSIKESTNRSEIIITDSNRNDTTAEYYGVRGSSHTGENYMRTKSNITESNKQILPSKPFLNLTSTDKVPASELGYGKNSYYAYNNNRSTNDQNDIFGNLYGGVYANVIEPVVHALRPTRKTNTTGNLRESGNVGVTTKGELVYNPNDRPLVTNREMDVTKLDFNHLNVQRQKDGGYRSNEYQPVENQRSTTNYNDFGIAGGRQNEGEKLYDAAYKQTSNNNKKHISHTGNGNMNLYNPYVNVNLVDNTQENTRAQAYYNPNVYAPNQQLLGTSEKLPQNYENNNEKRMDGNLLQAFKDNPYTQPLGSVA